MNFVFNYFNSLLDVAEDFKINYGFGNPYADEEHLLSQDENIESRVNRTVLPEVFGGLAAVAGIAKLPTKSLIPIGVWIQDHTGICPSSLVPRGTADMILNSKFTSWELCTGLKPGEGYLCITSLTSVGFIGPIIEEVDDRIILQELLLRQIPKAIIKKISPEHVPIVDHIIFRTARIFASSVIFGLRHQQKHACINGDVYPSIIFGVLLGTLQEITGNPLNNIIAHMAHNILIHTPPKFTAAQFAHFFPNG